MFTSIKRIAALFTTTQGRKMLTDKIVLITGGAQGLGLAFSEILLEQDTKGKVVVISGGASGIGLAFVEIFLERKSKVSFCDINDDAGKETLQNLQNKYGENKVMFQKCNVTSQDEMAAFFKSTKDRFGRLDVVINNAGIGGETTSWERTVDVNLVATDDDEYSIRKILLASVRISNGRPLFSNCMQKRLRFYQLSPGEIVQGERPQWESKHVFVTIKGTTSGGILDRLLLYTTTVKGMISGTFLGLDYLRTDRGGNGGVIVNVSSAAGLRANPLSPVYCASKSGVVAFSQSLACNEDVVNGGVRINTICPAFADTPLVRDLFKDDSVNGNKVKEFVDKIGIMTTQEVAEGLLELVTDERKNGAILTMSKRNGKAYVSLEYKTIVT